VHIHCPHFQFCSGCQYNETVDTLEILQRARRFIQHHFAQDLPLKTKAPAFWRTRAKLAVRGNPTQIGLFAKGSHAVFEIPNCQVHHPRINEAVRCFKTALQQSSLTGYEEQSHSGDLRYLQLVVERRTEKVQLTCVLTRPDIIETASELQQMLIESDKKQLWHSMWININQERTNRIFGPDWKRVAGHEFVWEQIAGHEFAFGPEHFGQVNLAMYEQMIQDIQQRIPPKKRVVELYGGIGIIGICLVKHSASVVISEIQEMAKPYFEIAKERLPPAQQGKLHYVVAPAEQSLELVDGNQVCIVDPPRKGLGAALLHTLLETKSLEQLVYISCDWHSLERDCLYILKNHPEWKLKEALAYLFFPGTNQIETIAFFVRS
jgi:23S rRNA (uracil1939-C5)-methyltransferase